MISEKSTVAEYCQKVNINDFLKVARDRLKEDLVQMLLKGEGYTIGLTTAKTGFRGERIWFVCPRCTHRVGVLYRNPSSDVMACRKCLGLVYKKQRYKGMIEDK